MEIVVHVLMHVEFQMEIIVHVLTLAEFLTVLVQMMDLTATVMSE